MGWSTVRKFGSSSRGSKVAGVLVGDGWGWR
jgi:hypothetical protein